MSKECILQAAEQMLRDGEEIHVRTLSRKANVSTGTIYNTYTTIDEMVLDLAAVFWTRVAEAIDEHSNNGNTLEKIRAEAYAWASDCGNGNFLRGLNRQPSMHRIFPNGSPPAEALYAVQHAIGRALHRQYPDLDPGVVERLSISYTLLFRFLQSGLCEQMPLAEEEDDRVPFILRSFDDLIGFVNLGVTHQFLNNEK